MSKSWFDERNRCPVCESEKITIRYRIPYSDQSIKEHLIEFYSPQGGIEFQYLQNEDYILCDCKYCGVIFQKKIPNEYLMERLYEHWIDPKKALENRNNRFNNNPGIYNNYINEIRNVSSCLKSSPSDTKFLDFGMGWGDWLLMANKLGFECYGLELSQSRIEYAESKGINVINWDEAKKLNFDFINAEQVFEHIPEPLITLRELKKLLKPNGIIKISVPTPNNINKILKRMDWKAKKGSKNSLNDVAPLEHIQCYSRSSLLIMAKLGGMTELTIPLIKQWYNSSNWINPKSFIRNLLIPVYRNILRKQNYIFLKKEK